MNNRQYRLIAAAETAIIFVLQLKNVSARLVRAAERLREALRAVKDAGTKQRGAQTSRTVPRYSVTRAKTILVRKHLHPVAADALEMFAGLPGIEDTLRMPRIKDAPEKHLKAAERVRRLAEEHEEEFIKERDYSENFLEKFDNAVRDLEAASRVERTSARAKYSRATEDVRDEITRLRRAFDALDTRVAEAYLEDRDTLKQWRRASRVRPKTGRPKKRKPPHGDA